MCFCLVVCVLVSLPRSAMGWFMTLAVSGGYSVFFVAYIQQKMLIHNVSQWINSAFLHMVCKQSRLL